MGGAGFTVAVVWAARAGGGQAEQGEQAGGGDQPGFPGPDDRAGELPGADELSSAAGKWTTCHVPRRTWLDNKIDMFLEELAASSMHLDR